jgi:hypothetical protein
MTASSSVRVAPSERSEVAVDVVDELLGLQVGVVVGQRHRERIPVEVARAERADHEARPLEGLVDGRRLVQAAGLRLEVVDVEAVRIDVAVPPDDVERVVIQDEALQPAPRAHDQLVRSGLAVGLQRRRRVEVALGERRVLQQLAVAVAIAARRLDLAGRVERQPGLRTAVHPHPVGRAARDHDIVVARVGQRPEDRLHGARSLVDEQHLVALAVAIEGVELLRRLADGDLNVVVEHQDAAPEDRVAGGAQRRGVRQPVHVRVGDPLVQRERLERADLGDVAGRAHVMEDRLVAGEALVAHDLLDEQPAILVAELGMALGRQIAHRDVPHQRFPRSACSRSIASKRALKLPSPKPRAPWRSMISKKIVGRSPSGFVKICSR